MSHVQAHQVSTFNPKSPGYFLIFSLRRRSLLSESIKVLPRNTLQFLCHCQVRAGLGRQLGTLEQQPEEGPYNQPQNIQSKKRRKEREREENSLLHPPKTPRDGTFPEAPWTHLHLCPCSSLYRKVPSLATSKTKPPNRDEHKSASYKKPPQGFQKK